MAGDKLDYSTNQPVQETKSFFEYRRLRWKHLTATENIVFEYLCDCASEKNDGWCWPSHETIGQALNGLHRETVSRAIKELETLGLLEVEHQPKGSHFSDRYSPATKVTANIESALLARSSRRKIQREESHVGKNDVSRRKIQRGHVGKSSTNESNLTNPNNDKTLAKANGAKAPLARPIDIFRIEYQEAERGEGETKTPNKDKATVIGKAYTQAFARAPDYGRLLKMAKELNSGWELIKLMLNCGGCDIGDDPHDYVQKIISARKKGDGRNQLGRSGSGTAKQNSSNTTAGLSSQPVGGRQSLEELNRI